MPPSPSPSSNIRAFVRWREPSVYAGEEIECIITFKNVATDYKTIEEQDEQPRRIHPSNGYLRDQRRESYGTSAAHSRKSSVAPSSASHARTPSTHTSTKDTTNSHRPTLSLTTGRVPSRGSPITVPAAWKKPLSAVQAHGRSLSIMSFDSQPSSHERVPSHSGGVKRPGKTHARAASLQSVTRPPPSPYPGPSPAREPSPLSYSPSNLTDDPHGQLPIRPARRKEGTVSAGNTPQLLRQSSLRKASPGSVFTPTFQFPGPQRVRSPPALDERPKLARNPSSKLRSEQPRPSSPGPPEGWTGPLSNLHPVARVMSEESTAGTPRTSSEIYSASNHSDETLTSEHPYQTQQNGRLTTDKSQSRQPTKLRPTNRSKAAEPETLMMGYAQTMGYFVLDGGLVNAAPFEEVKRKGVQGGGGVIGVDRPKNTSGMFGAFSWGNIGESLGGLLGSDEKSSLAQMKATAGSKSIPLLSTPQNLLFVDLPLAPGESKSFAYRFPLPRGLPPSHKGRAIKVSYHLLLGIQRPEGQIVKHIEIPFRVLGSYNARGEALGHDLMSPYVLMHDAAKSQLVTPSSTTPSGLPAFASREPAKETPQQGLEDFLRYTERLLEQPQGSHEALVSPTLPTPPNLSRTRSSLADQQPASVKEAIDLAILRANYVAPSGKQQQSGPQSANRFNIARAGQPVAVLTLLRPSYRLGEVVTGTVDFTAPTSDSDFPSQAPTYSFFAELESAERVDASLALRSSNSIHRVTKKIHSSARENTIFARQASFSLNIPPTASPSFETTGVSLVWRLRVEFTTQRKVQGLGLEGQAGQDANGMLEELGTDERGTVLIAKERLVADTFEISVPLKVYGVPGIDATSSECEPIEV